MTRIEFNTAVQGHYGPLKGYAMKLLQDVDDANDLVQETMLRAFRNQEKFVDGTNLRGWLYTIMKNIFINQYRRISLGKVFSDHSPNQYYINAGTERSHNMGESRIMLREIDGEMNQLAEKLRLPFVMSYQGYKYEEIASRLSLPLGTVKIRIHHARHELQRRLAAYGKQFGLRNKQE